MTHHFPNAVNSEEEEQLQSEVEAVPCLDPPSEKQLPASQRAATKKRTRSGACLQPSLIIEASGAGSMYGLRRIRTATRKAKEGAFAQQEGDSVDAPCTRGVQRAAMTAQQHAEWDSDENGFSEEGREDEETEVQEDSDEED